MDLTITFVGSGDAFGSGGRLQTCILVDAADVRFAIDFGATSLPGLRRLGIHPNSLGAVILTHLHGDHCAGVPFLLLDAMLGAKREAPLSILGPAGARNHLERLQEALFPGSRDMTRKFPLHHVCLSPEAPTRWSGLDIATVAARHTRETEPMAVRVRFGDVSIAYTGDGEYTDELAELVRDVDLLIAEAYFYDKPVPWHLNYPDIAKLSPRQVVLTHMHDNMLAHAGQVPELCASDGLVIRVQAGSAPRASQAASAQERSS